MNMESRANTAARSGSAKRGAIVTVLLSMVAAAGSSLAADWYPSKYGAGDEIGAANNLSEKKVQQGAKLIKTGKSYSLGITLGPDTPAYPPRSFKIYVVQPGQAGGATVGENKVSYNDDIIQTWIGIGTQIDGLGHVGIDNMYYNGNKASTFAMVDGLRKLGTEKIPPIVTRGVLLDIALLRGVPMMKEGDVVTVAELQAAAKNQGVTVEKGDVVLIHTGWLSLIGKDNKRFATAEPGIGVAAAKYLADLGVVAVGADTWALEVIPFEVATRVFEVHQTLLAQNGVYILENINTAELAKDKAYEFLFVLGQAKIQGSVQAIINPIAIR